MDDEAVALLHSWGLAHLEPACKGKNILFLNEVSFFSCVCLILGTYNVLVYALDRKFGGEALMEVDSSTVHFITDQPGEQLLLLKRIRESKAVSIVAAFYLLVLCGHVATVVNNMCYLCFIGAYSKNHSISFH